jgi:hypothetical protein
MYEKTDQAGYYRDLGSGAIVSTDADALRAYKLKKQKARELNELKDRQESIEQDVDEIKSMLKTILEKL